MTVSPETAAWTAAMFIRLNSSAPLKPAVPRAIGLHLDVVGERHRLR